MLRHEPPANLWRGAAHAARINARQRHGGIAVLDLARQCWRRQAGAMLKRRSAPCKSQLPSCVHLPAEILACDQRPGTPSSRRARCVNRARHPAHCRVSRRWPARKIPAFSAPICRERVSQPVAVIEAHREQSTVPRRRRRRCWWHRACRRGPTSSTRHLDGSGAKQQQRRERVEFEIGQRFSARAPPRSVRRRRTAAASVTAPRRPRGCVRGNAAGAAR